MLVAATQQITRSPRVRHATFTLMPAASTTTSSVQVLDFEEYGLLIPRSCLVCDFCSSGQCFASGFLQIPPHDGHPCLRLTVPLVGPVAEGKGSHLLWRQLISADPSQHLSMLVAATQQITRSPRVRHATFTLMPAASTTTSSVQVLDFEEYGLLIPRSCLVCDFCSSGQCFASGFLQIPPHDGHPCLRLTVPLVGPVADFHRQVSLPPPQRQEQRQS